jgi:hypothetical protein
MDIEALKGLMPWFLDGQSKSDLFGSVKQLAGGGIDYTDYFASDYNQLPDELSQGDLLDNLPIIALPNPRITNNLGMVLSNSCSMSRSNGRATKPRVVYAPAISLSRLTALITNRVDVPVFLEDVRKQQIMNLFYLPVGQYNNQERVVLFDHILSMDWSESDTREHVKIRLSRKAYFHLLIKITAYFARTTQELVSERP